VMPMSKQNEPIKRMKKKNRSAKINRVTSETNISITLNVDGSGKRSIDTGIAFLDHMLDLFAKHGMFDLTVKAKGDIDVDIHHTNEDIALALGSAFSNALGDKKSIRRYGFFLVPMDEALVRVVLDISNRPSLFVSGFPKSMKSKTDYSFIDCEHFLQSFTQSAGLNLHLSILSGRDRHHIIEAVFKALARALDQATDCDTRSKTVPSTKGIL
jgi:imidazoleglycerol-phosphate dehydratase